MACWELSTFPNKKEMWHDLLEIDAQGWSLNPGRYVGVADRKEDDFDFFDRLEALNEELESLNAEARELKSRIAENILKLLGI